MRFAALSVVLLGLFVGYSQSATIFREGREDDAPLVDIVAAAVADEQPTIVEELKEVVSELRKESEPAAEAVEAIVEQKVAEEVAEKIEEVVPVQALRVIPTEVVEEPVAIVVPEEVVSELRKESEPVAEVVEAIVEQKVAEEVAEKIEEIAPLEALRVIPAEVVVRNAEVEEPVVSELKSTPLVEVEEAAAAPIAFVEEAVKAETAETVEEVPALKSVPLVEPEAAEPVAVAAVEPETAPAVVAVEEEAVPAIRKIAVEAEAPVAQVVVPEAEAVEPVAAVVAAEEPVVPVLKTLPAEEVAAVAEEEKPAVVPAVVAVEQEVAPVEGTVRQNSVEAEPARPTFLQQAQQVLTNNPITQFIQNNPLTNAIRGGTTPAAGSEDEAAVPTTARPGLFQQLFNPSTVAPAANSAPEEATTASSNFIQTAFSNIQSALPQPPNILANIQNIFTGNRANATAAAPAAAAAEPQRKPETVTADEPSTNAIDQATKKKRIETEVEKAAVPEVAIAEPVVAEEEAKPIVALLGTERLDAQVKDEQVVAEAEVKTQ